jgi:transposase-like protein
MSEKRVRYSAEFKSAAVRRMADCKTISGLAEELGVRREFYFCGASSYRQAARRALKRGLGRPPGSPSKAPVITGKREPSASERRSAELEQLLGRKQLELDFFKQTFEQVRGAAANRISGGDKTSIAESKPHSRSKGSV